MDGDPPVAELTEVEVDLVRRRTLGGPGDHLVSGQVSLGRAEAVRLRRDTPGVSEELAVLIDAEAEDHHYYLVHLSCTFRAGDAPIVGAVLSVELLQARIAGVPDPLVWSMEPLRLATPMRRRRAVTLGPAGKFVPVDSVVERVIEFETDVYHLVAQGEGESQVEWVFTATQAVDLVGVHHLRLVARTSARVACRADLALAAKRRERRLGLVPYRADIPAAVRTVRLSAS